MKSEYGYDDGARFLHSDSQIIGRVERRGDKLGTRLSLDVPGLEEPVVAIVEKLNAASMSSFCELARGTYNARKEEQAAQAERRSRDGETKKRESGGDDIIETFVQAAQTNVEVNPLDSQSVRDRLVVIADEVTMHRDAVKRLDAEANKLSKVLEVLNAFEDDEETDCSVPTTETLETRGPEESPDVVGDSCETQLQPAREDGAIVVLQDGLDLTSPPPDTIDS